MNIYELSENIKLLSEMIDEAKDEQDEDLQTLVDTLEANEDALDVKMNNIGWLLAETEQRAKAYEEQEKRFKAKKEQAKKKEERLKELVAFVLQSKNVDKLQTNDFNYSFRKSTATRILNLEEVPAEFIKTTVKEAPILADIKNYIKEHGDTSWAKLEERKSLQVK